jgi:hypothetical protein
MIPKYENLQITDDMYNHFEKRTRKHIELVNKYATILYNAHIYDLPFYFLDEIVKHDKSKFYSDIYLGYVWINAHYNLGMKYPSKEIELLAKVSCEKHYKAEDHHPEHFGDCNDMTISNITEMIADWSAMSEELGTSLIDWYNKIASKKYNFNEENTNIIKNLIKFIENYKMS